MTGLLAEASHARTTRAGWTDEEIEQGCPEGGGMGGMGGGVPMEDLIAAMFAQQRAGGGGGGFPGGFPGGFQGRGGYRPF